MPLTLKRRGQIFWVRGTVRGQRCYETTGTADPALAEEFRATREAELFRQAVFGQRATVSFQRAALSYLEHEPRSKKQESYVLVLVDYFGGRQVSSIDQAVADAATAVLLSPVAAPSTKRRNVLGPLTAILNHAAKRNWCDRPHFDLPKVPPSNVAWMTPEQYLRLEIESAPHLRPLSRFRVCCGARLGEALLLDWRQVDLAAGHALFLPTTTKSSRLRRAALPPSAIAALSALPHRRGRVFLKPGKGRCAPMEPYADTAGLSGGQIKTAWNGACRRAGLAGFTPHDLRDSWATWFNGACHDLLLLRDEGGWASLAMVERYSHLMPVDLVPEIADVWGPSHPRIGTLTARASYPQGVIERA
jgi:integrase